MTTPETQETTARDLHAIKARRDAVMQLTFDLAAKGDKAFRMSIPPQPSDADLLLMYLCADVDALCAAVRRGEEERKALARMLEKATVRLEILYGRMEACSLLSSAMGESDRHALSHEEVPDWIAEQRACLATPSAAEEPDALRQAESYIASLREPLLHYFGTTDPELLVEQWERSTTAPVAAATPPEGASDAPPR